MNRRNLAAVLLTLAFASCLALAQEPASRPSGLVPAPGADPNAGKASTRPSGPPLGAGGAAPPAAPDATTTSAPASQPEEEEIDLPPYYQVMAKETDMGDAQQKKLAAEVKKRTAAVMAWEKENGEQRKSLRADLVQAHKDHDKDNEAMLKAKLADMEKDRKAMEKKLDAQIEAVLTEKQRMDWEAFLLFDNVIGPFVELKLDDSQQLAARNICKRALGRLLKVKDNKVEADKIYDELHQSIRERVHWTQAQLDMLNHKPTTAPATAPAAAPEPPKSETYLEGKKSSGIVLPEMQD